MEVAKLMEFTMGMKAMVLINITTEADLANGARGEIIDIVSDPREPPQVVNKSGVTKLCYDSKVKFNITCQGKSVKRILVLTAGYAFMDHKLQGQTIDLECVIVDLGKPAHRELSASTCTWCQEAVGEILSS